MERLQYLRKHLRTYHKPERMPPGNVRLLAEDKSRSSQKDRGIWSSSTIIWLNSGFSEVAASYWTSMTGGSDCSEDFSSRIHNNSVSWSDILKPCSLRNFCCLCNQEWHIRVVFILLWTSARQDWSDSSSGFRSSNSSSAADKSLTTFASACFNKSHSLLVWNSQQQVHSWQVHTAHFK